jgi:hypothetical protein
MTNTELKNKILETKNPEWFKNISETFDFSYVNYKQDLIGITSIYEFLKQQIKGWGQIENLPLELSNSETNFTNAINSIEKFINSYSNQTSQQNLNHYWQTQVRNVFTQLISQKTIPYNLPEVDFLLKVSKETPQYFTGAYNFIVGKAYTTNTKELLFGAILAYEFKLKDFSEITERKNAEKNSISKIRNDFQIYFSEAEKQILNHFENANTEYKNYVEKIDNLKNEKEAIFNDWFENTKNEEWNKWFENTKIEEWDKWINPTKENISELEKTYKEKLKLEEPAKYWSERAIKLKSQGWISLLIIVVLVLVTCWSLAEILWTAPNQIYVSWFGEDKSAAIRWSIIYITLISFIGFCIKSLTKVMFSSFHLARDCEERHTLTYFYLALLKDGKVDEKDRQLIMQSLFSRAETGLLKDDSSPTMPNDAISKIISK